MLFGLPSRFVENSENCSGASNHMREIVEKKCMLFSYEES
ncbi:MAG: hypothetical protein ACI92E_003280, partial [Oceanicoccus sp.]